MEWIGICQTLVFGSVLGIMAIIDIWKKQIPVYGIVILAALALAFRLQNYFQCAGLEDSYQSLQYSWQLAPYSWKSLLGGMAIGGCLLLVSFASRGAIGPGDGMLLMASGVFLGFWDNLLMFFYGTLFSAAVAFFLLLFRKAKKGSQLPFVPFLAGAYLLIVLL